MQRLLERYAPPVSVTGGKRKRLRVFRDETELPTSADLNADIKNALKNSRFLIVLCSKTTAHSKWCMQEINYFKVLRGGKTENIVTILTEGEPSEVFPRELCEETTIFTDADGNEKTEIIAVEPLAANVSAPTIRESLKKLNREFLRIAAPLYGVGFDALYNRNRRRLLRRVVIFSSAAFMFLTAFAVYSGVMILKINSQNAELVKRNRELLIQESRYLSRESAELLDADDRIGAIKTALAAFPHAENDRPWTPQAEFAMTQALYAYQNGGVRIDRRLGHSSRVVSAALSRDGTRIASADYQNNIYIWDTLTGERVGFFSANTDFYSWGYAFGEQNYLYLIAGQKLVCVDAEACKILWETERETFIYYPFFGNSLIISNDGKIAALISIDGVYFADTANGDIFLSVTLLTGYYDAYENIDANGVFSTDDEFFYIGASDRYYTLTGGEPEDGKIYRVNAATGEITERALKNGGRAHGMYADCDYEIFAVATRDDLTLYAYLRETGEPLWETVFDQRGFRSEVFIIRHGSVIFAAHGNSAAAIDIENGEILTADNLSANVLRCFTLAEYPDRVVTVLENGEIRLTMLTDGMSSRRPLFGYWALAEYKNELLAADIFFDSSVDGSIADSIVYAFVPCNPRLKTLGQPYITVARYIEDENYVEIEIDDYITHTVFSECGGYMAFAPEYSKIFYVAETETGEIIYARKFGSDDSFYIKLFSFGDNGNIVVCAGEWLKIIDWRNDTIVYEFDPNEVAGYGDYHWDFAAAGDYAAYLSWNICFMIDTRDMSYREFNIDGLYIETNRFRLNVNGEIAFIKGGGLHLLTRDGEVKTIDGEFSGGSFGTIIKWSGDGRLLAAVDDRDTAIVYDVALQKKCAVPLTAPIGITFSPDNEKLLSLGADGTLYEYSLFENASARSLRVYGGATSVNIMDEIVIEYITLDERESVVVTAGNNESSFIVDIEEFALRLEIPDLAALNEKSRLFAQSGSGVRIRRFYETGELIEMAVSQLTSAQDGSHLSSVLTSPAETGNPESTG